MANAAQTRPDNPQTDRFPTLWVMALGVMVAIGPLSIDMYLPALPSMAEDFGVSAQSVAKSVPAYFVGLVFGQLLYGPLSDRVGRVLPMYVGMTIFVIASLVCASTTHEYVLFAARTVQALGACVTTVVTRAAIRDTLNPTQMAQAFSLMVLVMGLAPILAPSLGALVLRFFDWHAIFWALAGYGAINLLLTKRFLKETLAPEKRSQTPLKNTLSLYIDLCKDRRFMLPACASGLLQGAFFVYLSIASEIFMVHYGLSDQKFALLFGANAFGFVALTQVNQFLTRRFHLVRLLRFGAIMQLTFAALLLFLGAVLDTTAPLWAVFAATFFCIAGLGFTQPNASALALAHQGSRAGLASAAQGALQFSVGIFGGLLLASISGNPVAKLGAAATLLTGVGVALAYRLDPAMRLGED